MERAMTPEERIRRAEEIYYRRRNQNLDRNSIRIGNDNTRPNFVIIKKMILQIIICVVIYSIFYMIQNTEYIFSADVINKTKEILSYDINIQNLYNKSKEYINGIIVKGQEESNDNNNQELPAENNDKNNEENNQTESTNLEENANETQNDNAENIGGEEVANTDENLTQMEKDAKDIIATKSLISHRHRHCSKYWYSFYCLYGRSGRRGFSRRQLWKSCKNNKWRCYDIICSLQ